MIGELLCYFAETKEITKVVPNRMCFMNDIKQFTDKVALFMMTENMSIFSEYIKASQKIQGKSSSSLCFRFSTSI